MTQTVNSYEVSIVENSSQMKTFLKFPYFHYKDDENWIAPLYIQQRDLLDPAKNPYFNHTDAVYFLAEKNGKPAGRLAAFINHEWIDYNKQNTGFFGFFDCIDDVKMAKLLFSIAKDWLRERGMDSVMGPLNPGWMYEIGMLIEGFEQKPYIMMPWNKPYYQKLVEKQGFTKAMDLFAYIVSDKDVALDRIERAEKIVRHRLPDLNIRTVNIRDFKNEAETIRQLFNQAWAANWGFSPVGQEEFNHIAKDLKLILDKDFAHIAEINGKPIGFSVALPDMNQAFRHLRDGKLLPTGIFKLLYHKRKINRIRTALMGVIPEYQGKGVDALLHREAIRKGLPRGFNESELSWLLESNTDMLRVAEKIGGKKDKTFRLFICEL
ncbi:MAG: GNAT family N-acetyltransferase [Balneolales bacterium]|nr:GNAT family N-acetyltransferase [Balneolales bacterium]